jgi:autotransporter-associated beta strand protein
LIIGNGNGSGTFDGLIGPGTAGGEVLAITKTGTGTQALNGDNTYTGVTNVNAGTLVIGTTAGTGTTGQGTYNVANGARLGGDGTIGLAGGSSVNIAGNLVGTPGAVSPGAAPLPFSLSPPGGYTGQPFDATYTAGLDDDTVGTLTVAGNMNLDGLLLVDLFSPDKADLLDVQGALTLNNAGFNPLMEINGETDLSLIDFFDLGLDVGTRIDLVEFDSKLGVFENFSENSFVTDAGGHQIFLGNDGSTLFLQMTPEPHSVAVWVLLSLTLAAVCWLRRSPTVFDRR